MLDDYSQRRTNLFLALGADVASRKIGLYLPATRESDEGWRMLRAGQSAPGFMLPDADMEMVALDDYLGKHSIVLYFYPKDDTPGCTREAIDFSDLEDEFVAFGAVVVGVSRDDCLSHGAFRDKHGLSVRLLSDVDAEVCEQYGVLQSKEVDGVRRQSVMRSTFVIDRNGVLRHVLYGVKATGHAAEVLELVRGLNE